jgi:hypothetical protein
MHLKMNLFSVQFLVDVKDKKCDNFHKGIPTEVDMFNAFLLLLLGVGGSILALMVVCMFISQVFRGRAEKTCQIRTYFNWIMEKGTANQKNRAKTLKQHRDLEGLKSLVGDGFLVDY